MNLRPMVDDPFAIALNALVDSQTNDEFCENVLVHQPLSCETAFCDDKQGILNRRHPRDPFLTQIVVLETLQSPLLELGHF